MLFNTKTAYCISKVTIHADASELLLAKTYVM